MHLKKKYNPIFGRHVFVLKIKLSYLHDLICISKLSEKLGIFKKSSLFFHFLKVDNKLSSTPIVFFLTSCPLLNEIRKIYYLGNQLQWEKYVQI